MSKPTEHVTQLPVWAIALIFSAVFGLVGVVYASLRSDISNKADKTTVEALHEDMQEVKKGVHEIIIMHMKQGYKRTKIEDGE